MEKISEQERKMRIDFLKNLIKENEADHIRLKEELQELLDLDPLKQNNIKITTNCFCHNPQIDLNGFKWI